MSLKNHLLSLIISLVIALTSCTQNISEEQIIATTNTPIPTKEHVIIATSTGDQFPRPPIPTISLTDEVNLANLLDLNDCTLPCYMGITLSKTKFEEAKVILDSLDAVHFGESTSDNTESIVYSIRFDDTAIDSQDHKILYDLGLYAVDGVMQQIHIWIMSHEPSSKFQDYWSRYTPRGVFLQVGVPDEIYSGGGHLALVYKQLGMINTYSNFWENGQLCPQNNVIQFDHRFVIKSKNTSDALYTEFEDNLKNEALWLPIEESLGISVQEFYEQVIVDDLICFDIKTK